MYRVLTKQTPGTQKNLGAIRKGFLKKLKPRLNLKAREGIMLEQRGPEQKVKGPEG